jgi:hypothetical protein
MEEAIAAADERPLVFSQANVNVCWFQQVSVLRDWWVVAERKRNLGFIGRFVLGPVCRQHRDSFHMPDFTGR